MIQGPVFWARYIGEVWIVIAIPCLVMAAAHPLKPRKATAVLTVLGFVLWIVSGCSFTCMIYKGL